MLVSQPRGSARFLPVLRTGLWMHKGGLCHRSLSDPVLWDAAGGSHLALSFPSPIYEAVLMWGMGS